MINVVAAIIINQEGKILITQRNLKKSQGGLWEFPGGKIEPDETKEKAIIREIKEELTIDIKVDEYFDEKVFNYPEKDINLIALKCSKIDGNIELMEHEDYKWVSNSELENFKFAPADMFIVEKLKEKEHSMKIYNKLVRDNIPSIIEKDSRKAITRILNDDEYKKELDKKLQEEVKEYLEDNNVEELADIVEVIYGILDSKNVTIEEFETIRKSKVEKRGAFKERIFLEKVLEDGE